SRRRHTGLGCDWSSDVCSSDLRALECNRAAQDVVPWHLMRDARLIDVTHQVPRHDILCGSITLERAVDGFPPGTVHLAVVDPGKSEERRVGKEGRAWRAADRCG